jgi:hypothetical protein
MRWPDGDRLTAHEGAALEEAHAGQLAPAAAGNRHPRGAPPCRHPVLDLQPYRTLLLAVPGVPPSTTRIGPMSGAVSSRRVATGGRAVAHAGQLSHGRSVRVEKARCSRRLPVVRAHHRREHTRARPPSLTAHRVGRRPSAARRASSDRGVGEHRPRELERRRRVVGHRRRRVVGHRRRVGRHDHAASARNRVRVDHSCVQPARRRRGAARAGGTWAAVGLTAASTPARSHRRESASPAAAAAAGSIALRTDAGQRAYRSTSTGDDRGCAAGVSILSGSGSQLAGMSFLQGGTLVRGEPIAIGPPRRLPIRGSGAPDRGADVEDQCKMAARRTGASVHGVRSGSKRIDWTVVQWIGGSSALIGARTAEPPQAIRVWSSSGMARAGAVATGLPRLDPPRSAGADQGLFQRDQRDQTSPPTAAHQGDAR